MSFINMVLLPNLILLYINRMKYKYYIIFSLFVGVLLAESKAQRQADYVAAEKYRVFDLGGELSRNSLTIYPREINGTDNFWFDFRTTEGNFFYYVTPHNGKRELLFDNNKMAMALTEFTRETINASDMSFQEFKFSKDQKTFTFERKGRTYEYNRLTRHLKELPLKTDEQKEEDVVYSWMNFSPDKKYILYAKNHNLYVRGNKAMGIDTTEVQLTFDGVENYTYARTNDGYRPNEEMPAKACWCKDSRHAYVVLEDERKLRDFWVINSLSEHPELEKYKYEFPGDKYVTQHDLVIVDVKEKKAGKADIDKWPDQYVMVFDASPKGDFIYFERTKRTWDEVDVCSVNTNTLEVKELIHEVDKPYRDPHARSVAILNDGKDILFRSERTGWGHYYHYDGEGNLKNALSSGPWVCGHIASIDTLNRTVYFYAYGDDPKINPFYYRLYKASLDKEGAILLSKEDAQHRVTFLKSNKYYIDVFSRVDMEPKFLLKDNNGKVICDLATPDLKAVYDAGWKKPERFVAKAADNRTNLYGVMWKPANFDPNKKYPIISVVYPGPYFGFVPTSFSLSERYCDRMAQLGFIVIAVGHRGDSPMRGKAYHRFGYGNMRDYPLADDKYVIEQLAKRHSYIDIDKVGICGHSGGGFMAVASLLTYPDFYKAAVSCSGNHDNSIYNRGWGECYNGVREVEKVVKDSLGNEKKEYEYKFSVKSNAELAKNLKGNLMLVTGDMDKNVNPAHTYRLAQALIEAGKDFDMLVIPGAGHGYGSADEYFEKKMFRFFAKHLLGDTRSDYWGDINRNK